MRVVLDTNVLVSAMLTPGGTADQVLQLALAGELTLLFDSRIFNEYEEVLARHEFGIAHNQRRALLDALGTNGEPVVAVPLKLSLPDPDDRAFVEVARAGNAAAIVTGNVRHFKAKRGKLEIPVLTPRQLVDRLRR